MLNIKIKSMEGSRVGHCLIFGGLTALGMPLLERLLNEGMYVMAVRAPLSSDNRPLEEDVEMHFGRHALFRAVDEWREELTKAENILFLDTVPLFGDNEGVQADVLAHRLVQCIENSPNLQRVIVASHIAIYGHPKGTVRETCVVKPVGAIGEHADRIERTVIEKLLHDKDRARALSVTICRLPNLYLEKRPTDWEALHVEDAALGLCAILQRVEKPGIEVIQLTSGRTFQGPFGHYTYSYEKANQLIGFNPVKTMENDEA
jgi:nucleoside-diphosphate-sugar epimerase